MCPSAAYHFTFVLMEEHSMLFGGLFSFFGFFFFGFCVHSIWCVHLLVGFCLLKEWTYPNDRHKSAFHCSFFVRLLIFLFFFYFCFIFIFWWENNEANEFTLGLSSGVLLHYAWCRVFPYSFGRTTNLFKWRCHCVFWVWTAAAVIFFFFSFYHLLIFIKAQYAFVAIFMLLYLFFFSFRINRLF